jgi:hypothetical protein
MSYCPCHTLNYILVVNLCTVTTTQIMLYITFIRVIYCELFLVHKLPSCSLIMRQWLMCSDKDFVCTCYVPRDNISYLI